MSNELARINPEALTATVQQLPDITAWIQRNHDKGLAKGQALLDTLEGNGGSMDDQMYASAGEFIELAKKCKKLMNEKRAPITQLMDSYRSVFTSLENDFDVTKHDSIPGKLQAYRNRYAAEVERKRQEEARKANAEAMKAQALERYKSDVLAEWQAYVKWLCEYCVEAIKKQFDAMTLQNYEGIKDYIENFKELLPMTKLLGNLQTESRVARPNEIPEDYNLAEVRMQVYTANCKAMEGQFADVARKTKQTYLDMLSAKKNQLELAAFDKDAALQAEAEIKAHEQAEAEKLRQEQEQAAMRTKQEAELKGQQAVTATLFSSMEQAGQAAAVKTKTKKVLRITSPEGFLPLLTYWWSNEGCHQSVEDLTKTFKKMITYAEKAANGKNQEFVQGEGITWEDEVTAK